MMGKTCAKCGIEKSEKEFYKDAKSSDNLQSYCKECSKEASKKWKEKNLDYGIEYKCAVCGGAVFGSDWLCKDCYLKQGLKNISSKNWPDWIRALIKIERRNRYLEQQRLKRVEYLEDLYNENSFR
jgi:hypothetical protein